VLVQPAGGGTVPQDKPVVVFRFAQGEAGDPVDARSFVVTVDGQDRTALFQVSVASAEAWGPLAPVAAPPAQPDFALALPAGAHEVTARVCSVRGVCAMASAVVVAVPQSAASPGSLPAIGVTQVSTANATKAASSPGRKARVLRRVLDAARLLVP
jgi:hypothetical protein